MIFDYSIAELQETDTGGFSPRGAVKSLWKSRDFETIVSGPAETGKTWGCLQYADALLWNYPGAQGVMCRKIYSTLVGSAVRTYMRIIGSDSPIKPFGGEKPQWFDYPNGSRFWLVGMDNPGKALSSERDFIYINQTEELALNDFEVLMTRATGRGAVMPYTRIFGDCNPGSPQHWIKHRSATGKLKILESRHVDNPTLYTDSGELTEQGKRTMTILDGLTGIRRTRLFEGKWAKAEGLVYETFDSAIHIISKAQVAAMSFRRYVAGVDWGFTEPGSIQLLAVDGDGRACRIREVYKSRMTIDWWVARAKEILAMYPTIESFACDPSEPAYIQAFTDAGLPAIGAFNDIAPGVQCVQQRLVIAGDGRPRLTIMDMSGAEPDEVLMAAKKPLGLIDEMDSYSWPKTQEGKPNKEVPDDRDNHGQDALRYAIAQIDGLGENQPVTFNFDFAFASSTT